MTDATESDEVVASKPADARSTIIATLICLIIGIGYSLFSWRASHVPFDSPLHKACYEGNIALAEKLIDSGENINLQGPSNSYDTPLMLAIASNTDRAPLVSMLLSHGANVNLADESGRSTLDIAILYDSVPIVQMLIDHGAQINATDKEGNRPLSYAGVWTMNKPMRDFLIAHGAQ